MSSKIAFNTNLPEPIRTRADFTYNITPAMISITDTGLGKCPVIEDIEAVLRKIELGTKAQLQSSRSCAATAKVFGIAFDGTAKRCLYLLCSKPTLREACKKLSTKEN